MAWSNLERNSSLPRWLRRWFLRQGIHGRTGVCAAEATGGSNNSSQSRANGPSAGKPIAILIPAYKPNAALLKTVEGLDYGPWAGIFVVDDGSGPEYRALFDQISGRRNVTILSHAINMGKGAALKTGINFILCQRPDVAGVITVDADGQHAPSDVRRVAARFSESPNALVLGVRAFDGDVPVRSRAGNYLTRIVMRFVLGTSLSDTQTGLRAIPRSMLPQLLRLTARGYEFELETLIAAKHGSVALCEQPIRTIYEPGNPSSHFQPLRDSMRIYFVLLRFTLISITTAILDNAVFFVALRLTGNVFASQLAARTASVLYAYPLVRRSVFLSEEPHQVLLPRYVLLVAVNAALSYAGIEALIRFTPMAVFPAKMFAEALLFVINFLIQRDWIFTRHGTGKGALDIRRNSAGSN